MSKIKVDIIEDSSGNAIRFPSSPLADGYLKVSNNGTLSSVPNLPSKTIFHKIYDADTDGGPISNVSITNTLPDNVISSILAGNRCMMFFDNVYYLNNGWSLNSEGSNLITNGDYLQQRYNEQSGNSNNYTNNFGYIPNFKEGFSTGNTSSTINMVMGTGLCEFQITQSSGDYRSIQWRTCDAFHYFGQSRLSYNRVVRAFGMSPFQTEPLKKLVFNNASIAPGGGITLIIHGDD